MNAKSHPTGSESASRAWDEAAACAVVAPLRALDGALLPMLHALQQAFGYIDDAAIPLLADMLNLSRAEVRGTLGFYHDFRRHPPPERVVKLCRAEACQARGVEELIDEMGARGFPVDEGGAIETVFCLGNCARGPSALVGDSLFGDLDADLLEVLCRSGPSPHPAPHPVSVHGDPLRIFLPRDAAALAAGAEEVAHAFVREAALRGAAVNLTRTGSRGMLWLEPLVEIEVSGERLAYGPVSAADVPGLFAAGFAQGGAHSLALGPVRELDWLIRQHRLTFGRCGVIDPLSMRDYENHGGLLGLRAALAMEGAAIVEAVKASGLRGRGGAGFPAGLKWQTVHAEKADLKYIVCNADEGDSGSFADRMLMEGDPLLLIEGMAIAGLAVGARKGFIYIRSEYPHAIAAMRAAADVARASGMIGTSILGSGQAFDVEIRVGAGAYICGEETALLESLEGRRGAVRAKPPLPAVHGLFGRPTVVNNVLTLAAVPWIMKHGAQAYADFGMGRSRGTLPVQLGGNIRRGGLVELAFGVSLRTLIEDFGGGTASGRPVRAVQVGGPLGAYIPAHLLDTPLDYEALAAIQAMLGHGGLVVFDDTVDMARQARFAFEFCAKESCGKCTPCRIGATRGVETADRILRGQDVARNLALLDDLMQLMTDASLCALGGLAPMPVMSALTHFPDDFHKAAPVRATPQELP